MLYQAEPRPEFMPYGNEGTALARRSVTAPVAGVNAPRSGGLGGAPALPADQDYLLAAAALDLHGFYTGIERLFTAIASDVDGARPHGMHWHRELLAQMALAVEDLRPPVISQATVTALTEYLEFRHIVRNVYTFNLKGERITSLLRGLPSAFSKARDELLEFLAFLKEISNSGPATSG